MVPIAIQTLPLRTARLGFESRSVDPAALTRAVATLTALIGPQCREGMRIAVLLGNSPLFVVSLFAAISSKNCAVLIDPALTAAEIAAALDASDADLLVCREDFPVERAINDRKPQIVGTMDAAPYGALCLWQFPSARPLCSETPPPESDREFVLQFTSGVSGRPLIVTRSYAQAQDEIARYAARIALCADDVVLCPVPSFHSFGLFAGVLSSLSVGANCVLVPAFSPAAIAAATKAHRPTIFLGVPFMYELLSHTSAAADADFSRCRLVLSAGAPLPHGVGEAFRHRFGCAISQLYGSTEAGVIAVNYPREEPFDCDSVGRPLDGRRLRIVGEDGNDCTTGAEGEIVLASPATANGYVGQPEATVAKFRDGWYFTGDIGRLDCDGHLYITGRKSAFINVGGLKVDPVAVENSIMASGQVRECSVVGIARPRFGEFVRAYVVLSQQGDLERIRDHCRQHLAPFKIPREFVTVGSLPRSAAGKVLRKYLVDDAKENMDPAQPDQSEP